MSYQPAPPVLPDDDDVDEAPAFIDMNDAVEVSASAQGGDSGVEPMDGDGDAAMMTDDVPMTDDDKSDATSAPDLSKATFASHSDAVYAVACHYDSATSALKIASGGGDDRAYLHVVSSNANNGGGGGGSVTIPLSHPHKDTVSCVALNDSYVDADVSGATQQKLVAIGSYDGTVVLYDAVDGKVTATLEGPSDVEWLCFHPKGGTVLLVGSIADGTVWMYHLPTSKCLQVFVGHEDGGATAGAFTPDGKVALSAGGDGTVRVWAPKKGTCKHVFRLCCEEGGASGGGGLTCLAAGGGDDGQLALAGGENGKAYVMHLRSKKVVATLPHFDAPPTSAGEGNGDETGEARSVEAVEFAPPTNASASHWCATAGVDGTVKIWDLGGNGARCRQACVPSSSEEGEEGRASSPPGATRVRWHPTLPYVAASYTDGTVRIWDARSGQTVGVPLTGHGDMINDMDAVFAPGRTASDGTAILVTASDDKTVKLFEVDLS